MTGEDQTKQDTEKNTSMNRKARRTEQNIAKKPNTGNKNEKCKQKENAWKTQWMQNSILNLLVNEEKEWVAITSDTQWNGRMTMKDANASDRKKELDREKREKA